MFFCKLWVECGIHTFDQLVCNVFFLIVTIINAYIILPEIEFCHLNSQYWQHNHTKQPLMADWIGCFNCFQETCDALIFDGGRI